MKFRNGELHLRESILLPSSCSLLQLTSQTLRHDFNKPAGQRLACVRFDNFCQLLVGRQLAFAYATLPAFEAGRTKKGHIGWDFLTRLLLLRTIEQFKNCREGRISYRKRVAPHLKPKVLLVLPSRSLR